MARILIIDDEPNILRSLGTFLEQRQHLVATAPNAASALAEARNFKPDLMILDVRLGRDDGLALLPGLRELLPDSPVVMISGHGDIPLAVRALQAGARDFLEKPLDSERLLVVIEHALQARRLEVEVQALKGAWKTQNLFVGSSAGFAECLSQLQMGAASELCLLIAGPNGSGKEVLARWAHLQSPRAHRPLVSVNCAAIPAELAESQLFGHVKGAFTGAVADHEGYFAQADGGTLFLDEIGELPAGLQAKLLRAIEYGEIQAVGAGRPRRVSVRLISATNRDLAAAVREGRFREDLFYRVNQLPVRLPGLAERRQDIPGLCAFLLAAQGQEGPVLSPEALAWLAAQAWPGNVRQLKNLLARALVLCPRRPITAAELERLESGGMPDSAAAGSAGSAAPDAIWDQAMPLREARQALEKRYVTSQLAQNAWSVRRTAERLGLLPNNLSRRLGELGIRLPDERSDPEP